MKPTTQKQTEAPPPEVFRGVDPARLASWASYALLAAGLAVIAFMAYSIWIVYTPLPWVDQWIFLQELVSHKGSYGFDLIWRQHNDHRIPIPKLFYLADVFWFGGRNLLLLGVIFAIQTTHAAWLTILSRRMGGLRGAPWRTTAALAAICLFSMRQSENLWFGSDLPMVIPYFSCTVAVSSLGFFYWTLQQNPRGKPRYVVVAWIAAMVASLSMSNGLFLWPLLVLLMLVWRIPARYTAATAVMAAALYAAWFTGYRMPIRSQSFASPPALAEYLLVLYGSSWSCVGDGFGKALSAVAIPAVAAAFVWVLVRRRNDVFAVSMLSLACFALLSTAVTALGRVGMGIEQARSDRYQTAAMLLWFSIAVLLIRYGARAARPWTLLLPLQIGLLAVLLSASRLAPQVADGARIHANSMRAARLAIEAGVNHAASIEYVIVPPYRSEDVLLLAQYLRDRRWSIFAGGERAPLGREISRVYDLVPAIACAGALDPVPTPVADPRWSGFRLSGWAWDRTSQAPAETVVLADRFGRLVGAGQAGFPRPEIPFIDRSVERRDTGFLAYIPPDLRAEEVTAYAILADGASACPLHHGAPVRLNPAAAAYAGPDPTGLTRNLTRNKEPALMGIDLVGEVPLSEKPQQPVPVPAGRELIMRGWILDPESRPGRAADIVLDGVPLAAGYAFDRRDLAHRVAGSDTRCGFEGVLPPLAPGPHTITVRLVPREEEIFYQAASSLRVVAGNEMR